MTTEQVILRVKQLIALSASSSEEEARSAALAACRLIREHHLELVPSAKPEEEVPGVPGDFRKSVNDFFDVLDRLSKQQGGGRGGQGRGGGR